jgi:hypothetical protein
MNIINNIIPGLLFFFLAILASKFPNKKLYLITTINSLIFAIIYYITQTNTENFRDNVDEEFKEGVVYYYDTVPTTDKCDTGKKDMIKFYYNDGTAEKHYDTSNNEYTCKKIVTQPIGGKGYYPKPIITYDIKPVVMDPSFNCPESLDYDNKKGKCFIPSTKIFDNPLPHKYKCEHAVGKITYRYDDRDYRDYYCDLSGTKFIMPNDKECPPGLKRRQKKCK